MLHLMKKQRFVVPSYDRCCAEIWPTTYDLVPFLVPCVLFSVGSFVPGFVRQSVVLQGRNVLFQNEPFHVPIYDRIFLEQERYLCTTI